MDRLVTDAGPHAARFNLEISFSPSKPELELANRGLEGFLISIASLFSMVLAKGIANCGMRLVLQNGTSHCTYGRMRGAHLDLAVISPLPRHINPQLFHQ